MNYDLINFTNISDKDFTGKWGGEEYFIKAMETKPYPRFLVNHFAKHLIDRILIDDGIKNYGNKVLRNPLEEKIIGGLVMKKTKEDYETDGVKLKENIEKIQKELNVSEKKRKSEIKSKRLEVLTKARKVNK